MSRSSLLVIAALSAFAAQAPQPPAQPPPFRTEANVVRVDVTVVDRHGEPATSLTADDFSVDEDGVPQAVTSFKFVSADGRPVPGDENSLPIRSPEHAAAEAARDEVRVFVVFWDDYHIGRMAEATKGRTVIADFVSSAFGPTDLVALMDPLLPVDALRLTRDRTELTQKVRRLEGRFGVYSPTRSAAEDGMLTRRDIAHVRSEVTISALKSAAAHLGTLKAGRKAIIFVSEGFPGLRLEDYSSIQELTDTANDNNTAIYTLDPSGLNGGSADILRTLAERTGGAAFVNTNTPERGLRQVVREASAFYLLGYSSVRNPQDGRFHKIGVKVKRPGLDVRARKGYWAPNLTELERARIEAAAGAAVPPAVTKAIAVLATARAERAFDVWAGAQRGADGQPAVIVAWTARGNVGGKPQPGATVTVAIKGAGGDRSFEAPLAAGGVTFSSSPGAIQLQTTVHDAAGNTIEDDRRAITVPDFSGVDLGISVPILLRARSVAEAKTLSTARQPVPFAGREFIRTDRLLVRFTILGANASGAAVSAQLTNKTGMALLALPVVTLEHTAAEYQIDLPLASIARGDYLIAIAAVHGDERVRTFVPLRVLPF